MKYFVFIALFLFIFISESVANPTIAIATADGPPLSKPDNTGFHDKIIHEAFARIGIDMEVIHLPAERALINANMGVEEGVYVRIAGMEKLYPNLIRVPEKITDYEFVAFSKKVNTATNRWEDLKPYDVGIITGWKILEKNIQNTKTLLKVDNPEILFDILDKERVDIIVYNRYDGYGVIKKLNLQGIKVLAPPLTVREMFLYLHVKHKELAPKMATALRSIKTDGTYERLFDEIIEPLVPK